MKSILLAAGMTLILMVLVTVLFRHLSANRARNATALYFFAAVVLALLWWSTPSDLGFLPPPLVAEPPWLDAFAAEFFFAAAFWGGILQLYNLADRGFSLRILIDLLETDRADADVNWILHGYSRGQGLDWMYRKRLTGMLGSGLVTLEEDLVVLTERGCKAATIFKTLRRLSKLDVHPR
jgi:hypothetical protein